MKQLNKADVAIVGGGILGLAFALEARQQKKKPKVECTKTQLLNLKKTLLTSMSKTFCSELMWNLKVMESKNGK